jgi:hypothetical protein
MRHSKLGKMAKTRKAKGTAVPLPTLDDTSKYVATTANDLDKESKYSVCRVKQIGRQVRLRLQQEQEKRHEIVRLTDHEDCTSTSYPYVNVAYLPVKSTEATETNTDLTHTDLISMERNSITNSAKVHPKKRFRTLRSSTCTRKKAKENVAASSSRDTVDDWIPNYQHLLRVDTQGTTAVCGTKDNQHLPSSIVRLHGLPIGTSSQHIRRFFSGLAPQRIMILLPPRHTHTNSLLTPISKLHIPTWDAIDDRPISSTKQSSASLIERYDSTFYRVYVKFASPQIAMLATQRTKELISVPIVNARYIRDQGRIVQDQLIPEKNNDSCLDGGTTFNQPSNRMSNHSQQDATDATTATPITTQSAAIAITIVPNEVANYLLRKELFIDLMIGRPIHETLEQLLDPVIDDDICGTDTIVSTTKPKLDSNVQSILWAELCHELHIPFMLCNNNVDHQRHHIDELNPTETIEKICIKVLSARGNNHKLSSPQLEQYYSCIEQFRKHLLYQVPFPSGMLLDPAFARDPILALNAQAVETLDTLLEYIDDYNRQRNRWKIFSTIAVTSSAKPFLKLHHSRVQKNNDIESD